MFTLTDVAIKQLKRLDFVSTPTITQSSAYSTGNVLGGALKIGNSAGIEGPSEEAWISNILQSLVVADPNNQNSAIDFFFFNQALGTAPTDKTAFAPTFADLLNCIAVVQVAATDYISSANGSIAAKTAQVNLGRVMKPQNGKDLYVVPVLRGTPTYIGNIQFRFQFSNGN